MRYVLIMALTARLWGQANVCPPVTKDGVASFVFVPCNDYKPDQSRPVIADITLSSQGSQALREGAGGLPKGFQLLHFIYKNRSTRDQQVGLADVFHAAVLAGIKPLGPEVTLLDLSGPGKRGFWPALGRIADKAPDAVPFAIAAARVKVDTQIIVTGGILLVKYLQSVRDAHTPNPQPITDNLIRSAEPITIRPDGEWRGYLGALYEGEHKAFVVKLFDGGDMVLSEISK